jgi:hypothetical protein
MKYQRYFSDYFFKKEMQSRFDTMERHISELQDEARRLKDELIAV